MLLLLYAMMMMTQFVPEASLRYALGFGYIAIILINLGVHLVIMIVQDVKALKLAYIKQKVKKVITENKKVKEEKRIAKAAEAARELAIKALAERPPASFLKEEVKESVNSLIYQRDQTPINNLRPDPLQLRPYHQQRTAEQRIADNEALRGMNFSDLSSSNYDLEASLSHKDASQLQLRPYHQQREEEQRIADDEAIGKLNLSDLSSSNYDDEAPQSLVDEVQSQQDEALESYQDATPQIILDNLIEAKFRK